MPEKYSLQRNIMSDKTAVEPTIQDELKTLLERYGVSLAMVAVSPSGAPVPVIDFLPERWRVEIQIVRQV